MKYTEGAVLGLRVLAYPFILVLTFTFYILHWLVSPFLLIWHVVRELIALPLRFLARFEALWYFLGCAILIGTLCGCILYGVFRIFIVVLDLDRKPVPKSIPATGHDAVSYRAAREEKRRREEEKEQRRVTRAKLLASQPLVQEVVREARSRPISLSSPLSPNTSTSATRSGLFQDIILEQTDEDSDSSFGE